MIEYIIPSDASEVLSKESGRKVLLKRVWVLERLSEYRYTFDLMVDDFPKLLYVDLPISRMDMGTTVWNEIHDDLLKQIEELPKHAE